MEGSRGAERDGPGGRDRAGDRAEVDEVEVILGIETSCDETAAALVTSGGEVRSSIVASQAELHAQYGGVVPEVASRRHLDSSVPSFARRSRRRRSRSAM